MSKSLSLKTILILQGAVILYSFADVTAKLASRHPFLSLPYLLWMGAELGILGVFLGDLLMTLIDPRIKLTGKGDVR